MKSAKKTWIVGGAVHIRKGGYFKLKIAPCPGGHHSAASAVGWDFKWGKMSKILTVHSGIKQMFYLNRKRRSWCYFGEFLLLLPFLKFKR